MTLLQRKILISAVLSLVGLLVWPLPGQQSRKAEYVFRGRVEQVDISTGKVTVTHEAIEGWMGAMTMAYAVDKPEILKTLKAGDQISARVYQGDLTLHDVAVAAARTSSQVTTKGLRLPELEALALANNPTMAQAEANRRVAAGLTKQAGLYPNPTIGYYGDEIRGGYSGGGKQGGFVNQTIVMGGKLGAARRVAELQAGQVETSGQAQRLRILNGVRMSFYHVLAAQRLEAVRQQLVRLAADATQTTRQLGNVGQADRPDLLQAEVEEQQASVGLRIATQNLQAAWRMLAAVCGKPDLPLTQLEGDFDAIPELTYEEWLGKTLNGSPEVRFASQEVERAEASLALARKAPVPDLQISANLSHNNSPLIETNPARATGVQGGAQVGVQIPIFNRNQGNIEAARGEIESAKQKLVRIRLQLERDLAGMFREYDAARTTVRQYKAEILPRAEQAYKLYQANYQNMAGAYPQVLISQRTLFQLESEYVQAVESAWQSSLSIQGFGMTDGLSEPIGMR